MHTTLSVTCLNVSFAKRVQHSSVSHSLFWTATSQTTCEWAPNKGGEGVRVWEKSWETPTGTAREKVRNQQEAKKNRKGEKVTEPFIWFNVRRCIHSGEICRYSFYLHFLPLYMSSLLQFGGKYTTFIWLPKLLVTLQIACCIRGNTVHF